jgi:hypothetical protein
LVRLFLPRWSSSTYTAKLQKQQERGHWLVRQANCSTDPAFVQAIGPTSRRTFETFHPHTSPTHTATGARVQNQQPRRAIAERISPSTPPVAKLPTGYRLLRPVGRSSAEDGAAAHVGILGSGVSLWFGPTMVVIGSKSHQDAPRRSRSGHLAMACRRASRQPPATATLSDAGRRVSAGRDLVAWSPVSPARVAGGSPQRWLSMAYLVLEPQGRVVLATRSSYDAARREAPSQLFGRSNPDGIFHVPHTLRIRRNRDTRRVGKVGRWHWSVCAMGPLSVVNPDGHAHGPRGSPRGPGTAGVGCVPSTKCRRCGAWPNLESDLVWAVSGHGNGVTADGCHRVQGCQATNAAVTQRSSTVVRAPSLGEWHDSSRDLSLSAACRAKCQVPSAKFQGSGSPCKISFPPFGVAGQWEAGLLPHVWRMFSLPSALNDS